MSGRRATSQYGRETVARLLIALLAVAFTAVCAEGLWSMFRQESLAWRALRRLGVVQNPLPSRIAMLDEERMKLAAQTLGPYALDPDPIVGMRMKSKVSREILGAVATTDAFGQRVRVGPEPEASARRIVILGDSVAFGFGVKDDETYAHYLEDYLAATMAKGAPRPIVTTIACPGWTLRGSCRYLRNHVEGIAPDIVILLPIHNDLHDTFSVNEVGHRTSDYDPAAGLARPHVSLESYILLRNRLVPKAEVSYAERVAKAGGFDAIPHIVDSDIAPESQRRFSEAVLAVSELRACLSARGSKFGVASVWGSTWPRYMEHRLLAAEPDLPVLPMFTHATEDDQLAKDPHPNPRCVRAGALRLAQHLLKLGWIESAEDRALPGLEPAYASRVRELEDVAARAQWAARQKELWARFIGSSVDLETAEGFHQIYGGVHFYDDVVGTSAWLGLANPSGAQRLEMRLIAPDARSSVHPLSLQVSFGEVSETVLVPPGSTGTPITLEIPLPSAVRSRPYVDVLVRSANWRVEQIGGVSRLHAYKLLRMRLLP